MKIPFLDVIDEFSHEFHKSIHEDLLDLVTYGTTKREMTVEQWLNVGKIRDDYKLAYPNARTAADIKDSPLMKALA